MLLTVYRDPEFFIGTPMSPDEIGNADAGGILPGNDTRTCRGAYRASCVRIGESHALPGQVVNIWRLMKLIAVTSQIGPTHVVNKNEHEIGFLWNLFFAGPQTHYSKCHYEHNNKVIQLFTINMPFDNPITFL